MILLGMIKIESVPTVRLRVRRINEIALAQRALEAAKTEGKIKIFATHGGSVNNSYGYPADTEGAVCVAWPTGEATVRVVRLPANKVTQSGVFFAVTGFRGLFDARCSDQTKSQIRNDFLSVNPRPKSADEIYSCDCH